MTKRNFEGFEKIAAIEDMGEGEIHIYVSKSDTNIYIETLDEDELYTCTNLTAAQAAELIEALGKAVAVSLTMEPKPK